MKLVTPLQHQKWSTFEERMNEYRRTAFCRTFGHGRLAKKGLRNPIDVCERCWHGVTP